MRTARTTLVVVAALGALTLTGCSSGGKDKGDGSSGVDEADLGPISRMMQDAYGEYDQESADAQQKQVEDIIATCMADEGFEYTPNVSGGGVVVSGDEDSDVPDWGTVEFAKLYGYGMTTSEELSEAQGFDTSGSSEEEMPEDPNADYVAAMTESEQQAYYEALYGKQDETVPSDDETAEYEYDWTTAGCMGKAQHEVYDVGEDTADNQALMDELSDLYTQAQDDSRYRSAVQEWSGCMADAGYSFSTPDEAQQSINDEYNNLFDPETGEIDEDKQAALKTQEIDTAVADATCKQTAKVDQVMVDVQKELETQFYADHKAEVDAWVAQIKEQFGK